MFVRFYPTVFVLVLAACSAHHAVHDNISGYKMLSLGRDTVNLVDGSHGATIVVFADSRSCLSCFSAVDEMLKSFMTDTLFCKVVVVMPSGGSVLSYRIMIQKVGVYLSYPHETLYEMPLISDSDDVKEQGELFKRYKIMHTPAILVLNNRMEAVDFIPYHELLDSSGLQVPVLARERLMHCVQNHLSR